MEKPEPKPAKHPKQQSRNYGGVWAKTPGRLLGIGLIRLYQLTLSGFVGGHCRHLPTCSEYAYESVARHGLWAGGFMALFRLLRCGPGGTHGFDPVPQHLPARCSPFAPWRYWRLPKPPQAPPQSQTNAPAKAKKQAAEQKQRNFACKR